MKKNSILIVDDEKNTREGIARFLRLKDFNCHMAGTGKEALELLQNNAVDIVLTDLRMPAMGGMDLINALQQNYPEIKIVVLTAYGSVETAVEAVKRGADDFLTKPINLDKLYITISKIIDNKMLKEENQQLKQQLDAKYGLKNIIGTSEPMQRIFDIIKQVAPSRATVLIQGESGTGKELIAQAIHQLSPRKNYAFVPVHCAALSDSLLESELFGHEKGAFTGAIEQRVGRFEQADKGTLFLDEISEVSSAVQVKLLRVLQEQIFERVGSTKPISVDLRVVAATNKILEEEVHSNKFREDLFYRLNVVTINMPPLRERKDDIPLLIKHYLDIFCRENNREPIHFDLPAINVLQEYSWPGNIRQLRNLIENIVVLSRNNVIKVTDLPERIIRNNETALSAGDTTSAMNIRENEKNLIIRALKDTNGNRTEAAKLLGMSRRTLYRKMEGFNITV
ncbi:MAG: sigma-54-dependent Fis family transcriptional regulator [Candidatus Auribacter fodinae]|jgi:DNA-binding NtrC family response regulator|uniref:Sigma-54-dependent Fis family transcriptional regulator n=1 Tax=Candidatus Auribacter fodinae TaxID=2093366 RepID=A0A3A4R402_9BACT|nr:MAG: sigma-54-dependent Fis family transcriptional regulator [Candidatus Auribacter fodinae]